jgi:hypothetical protein
MRKILATTAALAAVPVLAVPTGANAQANPGFYLGVEGGANCQNGVGQLATMVNLLYDFNASGTIIPYIGAVAGVTATGHADRSGPDAYNMALSLRRANAVKDDRWCRPPTACASRRTAASRSSFSNDPLSPRHQLEQYGWKVVGKNPLQSGAAQGRLTA